MNWKSSEYEARALISGMDNFLISEGRTKIAVVAPDSSRRLTRIEFHCV